MEAGIRIACSVSGTWFAFQNHVASSSFTVGAGEYIMRAALARAIAESFRLAITRKEDVDAHNILHDVLLDKSWGEPFVTLDCTILIYVQSTMPGARRN